MQSKLLVCPWRSLVCARFVQLNSMSLTDLPCSGTRQVVLNNKT